MTIWYIVAALMTLALLYVYIWVTRKAYSRKWEQDEPEQDPFDLDKSARH